MSIASTTFLFLFLPVSIGLYYLIPCKKGLLLRNVFFTLISLFFYAWGEPAFILVFMLLILLTWLLGKMAEGGRKAKSAKAAVALAVVMNVGVVLAFKKLSVILSAAGLLLGEDMSALTTALPIGMSFFGFNSISYVVDIYRGQCKSAKSILNAALYLSAFYKVLQGPIISYHEFEPQINSRGASWNDVSSGIWRLAIGLGKKMIIAGNLSKMVSVVFTYDPLELSLADAWLGCIACMIFSYFDFSGYSDMAIGLAQIFGFASPENFNYPYISTSIAEYWRRWHITLCAWFRDYLYYPVLLGPSVRFRKFLLRHNVSNQLAKSLQGIFVPTCVWLVTALWHGTNWNYTLWGLANSAAIIIEPHIKQLKNKKLDKAVRWLGVMLLLALLKPLPYTDSLKNAGLYLAAMFGATGRLAASGTIKYFLRTKGIFLLVGAVGCFPVIPYLKKKLYPAENKPLQVLWGAAEVALLIGITIISLAYLFKNGTVVFLYQQF